jgi:hypothetical protein
MCLMMPISSNSLSPQQLLQWLAAVPNYIRCTIIVDNSGCHIPCSYQTQSLYHFQRPRIKFYPEHTPCFSYIHFNIILTNTPTSYFRLRFIIQIFCVKYRVFKSRLYSTSVALFNGSGTWSEKCFCSLVLLKEWPKSLCAVEQEKCSTVLTVGKSHTPNSVAGTCDFNQTLQTSTHSAIPWLSAMLLLLIDGD